MNCYFNFNKAAVVVIITTTAAFGFLQGKAQSRKKVAMDIEFSSALHPAGTKLKLYREWPKRSLIDTGILNSDQRYVLHVADTLPAVYKLEARKPYLSQTIVLEKGVFSIEVGADSQLTVKGGALQQRLEEYSKQMKPLEKKWAETGQQYTKATNLEEKLAAEKENKVVAEQVQSARIAAIRNNLNNPLGQWLTYQNLNLWQQKELLTLKGYFLASKTTNFVSDEIEKKLQDMERNLLVGKKAPSFTLSSINGSSVSLEQLIADNKYILLDFWASWCTPCRATNRSIAPLYADLKSKGIEVVSISVDENKELWKKAVESDKIPWPQLISASMNSKAVSDFKVKTLPSTFLINKDGVVVKQHVEIEELKKLR